MAMKDWGASLNAATREQAEQGLRLLQQLGIAEPEKHVRNQWNALLSYHDL
jgi:hypothetical protein